MLNKKLRSKIFVGVFAKKISGNTLVGDYYLDIQNLKNRRQVNNQVISEAETLEKAINDWLETAVDIKIIERLSKIEDEKITVLFWYEEYSK